MPTTKTHLQQVIEELAGAFQSDKREPYSLRAMRAAHAALSNPYPPSGTEEVTRQLAHAIHEEEKRAPTFYTIRDDAPAWTRRETKDENGECLMFRVHSALDDRLPDDWVYATAARIAEKFTEYDFDSIDDLRDKVSEIADGEVDIYNSERTEWLASNLANAALVDEAIREEMGCRLDDVIAAIGFGQFFACERIANALIDAIEKEAEAREE